MRKFLMMVLGTAFLLTASFAFAQEKSIEQEFVSEEGPKTLFGNYFSERNIDIGITATTDIYSKYIWRGMKLDNDFVLQPGVAISGYGFDFSVWGSFDLEGSDHRSSDEVDTSISYTYDLENLNLFGKDLDTFSISVGHVYYDFPGAGGFSKESMLGFAYDTFLAPSFTWYHDYSRESQGGGDGDYLVLDLSHSLDVIPSYGVSLDLSGHVGYNRKLFINGEGGNGGLSAGFTIPLTKMLAMAPNVNYSMPFGGVKDSEDGNQKNEFYWGVGFSAEF